MRGTSRRSSDGGGSMLSGGVEVISSHVSITEFFVNAGLRKTDDIAVT
jgi:hypothetical protein